MSHHPTYVEQFDKITCAYFADELNPMSQCSCIIGNMLNNTSDWYHLKSFSTLYDPVYNFYTMEEIVYMEQNFLRICFGYDFILTEESLFNAMDSTLDMLSKIHESRGEIINPPVFTKRQLQTA